MSLNLVEIQETLNNVLRDKHKQALQNVKRAKVFDDVTTATMIRKVRNARTVEFNTQNMLSKIITDSKTLTIEKVLHAGNNGTVYAGTDDTGAEIAVKMFRLTAQTSKAAASQLINSVLRESQNMHRAEIPSEVIFDKKSGCLFLLMPKFPGITAKKALTDISNQLKDAITQQDSVKALTLLKQMFQLLLIMLEKLDDFHAKSQLVHGDAWLDNFIVNPQDNQVYLIDYGACCEPGINADAYIDIFKKIGTGAYHTAPEIPCRANCIEKMDRRTIRKSKSFQQMLNSVSKQPFAAEATRFMINSGMIPLSSLREYEGKITSKSDLHTIFASFLFETMLNICEVSKWHIDGDLKQHAPVLQIATEFAHWSMVNCCNSDWFYNNFQEPSMFLFMNSVKEARKAIMPNNATSEQARVDLPTAITVVNEFIQRIDQALRTSVKVVV